jgi:phosphoglycolate phosphatase
MKTVVFDLDGTLADTSGDLLAAANATFAALGMAMPLDAQDLADAALALRGGRAMLREGMARLGHAVDEAHIAALYPQLLAHYQGALAVQTRLYPGAERAVLDLRERGYLCAVCTNKPIHLAEPLLNALGVRGHFAAVLGAGSLGDGRVKPDPALYHATLAAAGGSGASLLVGDTQTDHETARAAGVPSVLVTFGPLGRGSVAALQPDALLDDYQHLPNLVVQLIGPPHAPTPMTG